MAPVVCMADFPMPRTDAAYPYTRRRQRSRFAVGFVEKYRTLETRQMSAARAARAGSPHCATASSCPDSISNTPSHANYRNNNLEVSYSTQISMEREEQWIILKRRAGLLNILARTVDLIRRNHILEKKVKALTLETRNFVNSVLNNPENKSRIPESSPSSSPCCEEDVEKDSVTSTTNESSSCPTTPIVTDEGVDESKKNISDDRNDEVHAKSSLVERDTRSPDTTIH